MNPILNTDSYKTSHFLQYPPGTTRLFAYLEVAGAPIRRRCSSGCRPS